MREPVCIDTNVCYADEASFETAESAAADDFTEWRALAAGVQIEIEDFFPHRNKKTEMALLAGVFLGYLQFDGFVGFLESAEEGRDWFASLKVDRSMFDLDDYVVFELAVEGMKDVVGGSRAIIFWVAPIEMMVIDEGSIKKNSAVAGQGAGENISSVGGGAAVDGWAGLAFGISLDGKSIYGRTPADAANV